MKIIELPTGEGVVVDDDLFDELNSYRWHMHQGGHSKNGSGPRYAARSERHGKKVITIRMHRQIMNCPKGMEVDHGDGDGLNNQKSNLEIVTKQENIRREFNDRPECPNTRW